MLYTRQRRAEVGILPTDGGFIPRRDNPLAGLLGTAWAHFDHTSIVGSFPVTEWQDLRGTAARDLDVVVGTGANLITLESGVALLTGTAGDYFSTPDSVAASITGDIDIRVRVAMDDWTPSTNSIVAAKDQNGQRSWRLSIATDGKLQFLWFEGTVLKGNGKSSVATSFTNGVVQWIRVTLDVLTGDYKYWTASGAILNPTASDFTQLGSTLSISAATSIDDTASDIEVGSAFAGSSLPLAGKPYRAEILNGIDGTLAVDFDPPKATVNTATFVTDTGETWTANGDAFVNATGFQGIYSRGSVGLETTAGTSITGTGITVYAVFKPTLAAPGADQFIFDARSTAGSSLSLRSDESNSDKYTLNQGSDIALSEAYDNDLQVYTAQFLGTASTKLTASAGDVTGDAGAENWDFGSIFMALGAGSTTPGLFLTLLVFDSAHSASQVALVQSHLAATYL